MSETPVLKAQKSHKALVLGGRNGLLGQALVRSLAAHGWEAVCLGREDGDLMDAEWMAEQLEALAPQAVFNTVAWTQVDDAEDHPGEAMRINRGFPALLGRLLCSASIPLVHYSTDFVFNGRKQSPYTTDDTPDPDSVYGETKLAGEQALLASGLERCCIIRTAWLFGPGRKNFVSTILNLAKERETIKVVHDQVGSPTYTMDLAEASLNLVRAGAHGVFHVVNNGQASWCELAAKAVAIANLPCTVQAIASSDWPQKAKRPPFSPLDTSHYTEVTGKTMRPWLPALRDYIFQDFLGADD